MSDDRLMNEMLATTHLIDAAEDWGRILDNPTLPWPVREDARKNAASSLALSSASSEGVGLGCQPGWNGERTRQPESGT